MSSVKIGGKLKKLSSHGDKLRHNNEFQEFLCVGCVGKTRIKRVPNHLCLKKLQNGAYLLQSENNCNACKKKFQPVYKIVSEKQAKVLVKQGVNLKCSPKNKK